MGAVEKDVSLSGPNFRSGFHGRLNKRSISGRQRGRPRWEACLYREARSAVGVQRKCKARGERRGVFAKSRTVRAQQRAEKSREAVSFVGARQLLWYQTCCGMLWTEGKTLAHDLAKKTRPPS